MRSREVERSEGHGERTELRVRSEARSVSEAWGVSKRKDCSYGCAAGRSGAEGGACRCRERVFSSGRNDGARWGGEATNPSA